MLPLPPEPKLNSPGRARSAASNCAMLVMGEAAGTTATSGCTITREIGAKSLSVSKLSLE